MQKKILKEIALPCFICIFNNNKCTQMRETIQKAKADTLKINTKCRKII